MFCIKFALCPYLTLPQFQQIDTNYRNSLIQALGQTADWFRRALAVEPVKGSLRLSGYSACGQDGGVQLPREYVEGIFFATNASLLCHLLLTIK